MQNKSSIKRRTSDIPKKIYPYLKVKINKLTDDIKGTRKYNEKATKALNGVKILPHYLLELANKYDSLQDSLIIINKKVNNTIYNDFNKED